VAAELIRPGPTPGVDPGAPLAWTSGRAWAALIIVVAVSLALDLGTKAWAFRTVAPQPIVLDRVTLATDPDHDPIGWHPTHAVLPGDLVDFKLVLNPGAVFGIGAHQRWFFIVFTLGALSAVLLVFGRATGRRDHFGHLALGLVLAGGLGNLYDRLAFGRVRDFLHLLPGRHLPRDWTWPRTNNPELFPWVFNVADLQLLLGMLLLLTFLHWREKGKAARLASD